MNPKDSNIYSRKKYKVIRPRRGRIFLMFYSINIQLLAELLFFLIKSLLFRSTPFSNVKLMLNARIPSRAHGSDPRFPRSENLQF